MYTQAFEAILKEHSTPAAVRSIELGGSAATLKVAITDSGFLELLADEANGGAGATLGDLYPLVALCGFHAVPLP